METQFAETAERVQDAIKQTSDLFTKTTTSLMDSFNKQMNTGYEFYKKLTETAQHDGKTKWADMIKESTASYQKAISSRSEEHTSELQSLRHLVCRLLLEKKN